MMMHVDQQKASRRYWDVGVSTAAKLKTLLKRIHTNAVIMG